MSDIDRNSYKALWDHLGKLGYKGYNKNDFLAATGKGDVVGMAKSGFNWLKEKGLPWFFEKLREALGSTVGAVLQQLLDYTGIGAIGVSILWAVMTLFDVAQLTSGVGSWAKLFFSVLGLLTAGALAKTVGGFLKPFFSSTGGTLSSFFTKIAEKPWFIKYIKPIVGWIGSKLSWAIGLLDDAGKWVTKKLGASTIGGYVSKAAQWLQSIAESLVKFAGFESKQTTAYLAKKDLQNQGKKLATKAVLDPVKDKGIEVSKDLSGRVGGETVKAGVELGYDISSLKKKPADIAKSFKNKGGVNLKNTVTAGKKIYKTYGEVGKTVDDTKKLAKSTETVKNNQLYA
jgi:hypothetical protein